MSGAVTGRLPARILGRAREWSRIAWLLSEARAGRSNALVISGEPGIGKSALCEWATARARGMTVLEVHGVESEVDLPFAGLSDLCAGITDRLGLLPAPQARALESALARKPAEPTDRFAIGAAVLTLLGLVAEPQGALAVIDDAHWIDASSADALLFAARRLRTEGVAMLVATRPAALFDGEYTGLNRLPLDRLDRTSSLALLRNAHGLVGREAERVMAWAGGNPLALLEIPRLLDPAQLSGQRPIEEPLALGPTLQQAWLDSVSGLPQSTWHGLLIAAANSTERAQPVLDALVAANLSSTALDAAEVAGVIALNGERLQFRHPLLRAAVYHGAPPPARRAAHRILAQVTAGEQRAWHLAQATTGENEEVAQALEQVARDAQHRGAPAAAARALERAAELSSEPAGRRRRLIEAAENAYVAGQAETALELVGNALDGNHDPLRRADAQRLRGRILVLRGDVNLAYRVLVDEARRVRAADPARAAGMLAEACLDCLATADIPKSLATAREACGSMARADSGVRVFAESMLASALILSGERAEAAEILDRSLPLLRRADPLTQAGELITNSGHCFAWLERHEVAGELLDRVIARAREASAPAALPWALVCRAELDFRTGRWAIATANAEEAAHLCDELGLNSILPYALECVARVSAATGKEALCRASAARAMRLVDSHRAEPARVYLHATLGTLELGLGQIEAAIGSLERVRELAARAGLREPNVVHWWADLVEAYVRAGLLDDARAALRDFQREASATRGRWALGTEARCRGLVVRRGGDADRAFADSAAHLERLGAPFELARTRLCHGEHLRRSGRRAASRQVLRSAAAAFERLGATPWLSRARNELMATGDKPRRRREVAEADRLTAHELQVVRVVAAGASNREAAAALFLSPKTIEFHLGHVYRKLRVRGRTELAALAIHRGWLDTPPQTSHAED